MNINTEMSLLPLLKILYKKRKTILILTGGTTIIAAVLLWLMPNYYKATTVFYPTNTALSSPQYIFGTDTRAMGMYGGNEDKDRMLSIANSTEFAQHLVSKFGLYKHYGVDSVDTKSLFYVRMKLNRLLVILKDELGGIELTVEDTNPVLAAAMANEAVAYISKLDRDLAKANQMKILKSYENTLTDRRLEFRRITDSIDRLNAIYRISAIKIQENLSPNVDANMTTRLALLQRAAHLGSDSMAKISAALDKAMYLQSKAFDISSSLTTTYELYQRFKVATETEVSSVQVVEPAIVPANKSSPLRTLWLASAALAAFIFSCIGILIKEQYQSFDWKVITD